MDPDPDSDLDSAGFVNDFQYIKKTVGIFVFLLFLLDDRRIRPKKTYGSYGSGSGRPKNVWILRIRIRIRNTGCAATFSFAQLAKGKSLGRSKPATKSQIQALQHTVWIISTISKPYWTAFYRNKMSTTRRERVRLFISRQSSLHIIAWDLDVERSQLCRWLQLAQLAKGKKSRP